MSKYACTPGTIGAKSAESTPDRVANAPTSISFALTPGALDLGSLGPLEAPEAFDQAAPIKSNTPANSAVSHILPASQSLPMASSSAPVPTAGDRFHPPTRRRHFRSSNLMTFDTFALTS